MTNWRFTLQAVSVISHSIFAITSTQTISAIAAMSTNGVVAYELVQGSVNGEKFLEFIQGKLVPEMLPYDGENL